MADSLRDQLIAAGYDAPKKEVKRKPRPHDNKKNQPNGKKTGDKNKARQKHQPASASTPNRQPGSRPGNKPANKNNKTGSATHSAEALQAIEERKKLKAQIKTLIDDNKLENWKGELVYRYLVEKRIRELYVTEEMHKQLAERSVAVTRLNGDTYLVPLATAEQIKVINPQWSVFNTDADAKDQAELTPSEADTQYADYKVPDDLKW